MAVQSHTPPSAVMSDLSKGTEKPGVYASDQWLVPEGISIANTRRIIVLIPQEAIEDQILIDKTREFALRYNAQVLFLGRCMNPAEASNIRRHLAHMAAKVRSSVVSYEQVLPDGTWIDAILKVTRRDDLIILPRDMSPNLSYAINTLGLPVYALAGLYPSLRSRLFRAGRRIVYDVSPIIIIVGFLWFQVQIVNQTTGLLNTLFTCITILFELVLIFVWSLFLS